MTCFRGVPERDLEFDLGNLLAFDPDPVDPELYEDNIEATCARVAAEITEQLVGRLCALPSHNAKEGRILELPPPTTQLPR